MVYNIGDFIITNQSSKPAIIISNQNNKLLVSISEFNGDYLFIDKANIKLANLKSEEKLSILANFGNWFYDCHKLLYQEIIIQNLTKLFHL